MANQTDAGWKDQLQQVPWWFKVIIGIAGIAITLKFFPIVEILNLFALIVLIPLCLIGSGWLVADGAADHVRAAWNATMERAQAEAAKMAAK